MKHSWRIAAPTLVTALIAAGTLLLPVAAASAAVSPPKVSQAVGSSASVTLVHGVRGLLADVVVDGKTVLKGFAYERASSPLQLPAGTHRVQVYQAGQAHVTALLDVSLTVKAGQELTAAVGFDASGGPKVFVFDDRLTTAMHSSSSVVVRNVSQGTAPQVLLDGKSISSGLAPGGQVVDPVRSGTHTVGLKVGSSWLLTNQPVAAASGRAMVVYIVGRQQAQSIALVADSITPGGVHSAAAVNSGGLPPTTTSSLMPSWLAGSLLVVGLLALAMVARVRPSRRVAPATRGVRRGSPDAD